jgi:nucleoside-diphosphate kinase
MPLKSAPGTIRGDFCLHVGRNICHGSDAVESAEREIAMWFPNGTQSWTHHSSSWLYE